MQTLIYFTQTYPGDGFTEQTFVDSELPALLTTFGRIILLPVNPSTRRDGYADRLPAGVEVDWSISESRAMHSRLAKLRWLAHPEVLRAAVDVTREAKTVKQWVKGIFQSLNAMELSRQLRRIIRREGLTPEQTTIYSLWFLNAAAGASRLGREGWKVATRAHLSDLYDDRLIFRSRRVRDRVLRGVGKVISISRRGREYLVQRYPEHAAKFVNIPLGSSRLFEPSLPEARRDGPVRFVTASRMTSLKRLDVVMETLDRVAALLPHMELEWTLIGDGESRPDLERKAGEIRHANLKVRMPGMMRNAEIQRLYAKTPPHWFIMMSESEGMPVSLGEAMSYGVPVLTTDVGDIGEMVTPECALILDADDLDATARRVADLVADDSRRLAMSRAALKHWAQTFDAAKCSLRLAGQEGLQVM